MLQALVEALIGLAEFFEAEARAFKRGVMNLGLGMVLLAVFGMMLIGAVALLLTGLYLYLTYFLPPCAAVSLVGLGALLAAGAVLWSAKRIAR
jgi:hypothetical protein